MGKVQFKYHPNVYDNDIIIKDKGVCECCGNEVDEYCNSMYCMEEVECICLECIANGEAAKKFDGEFVQDAEEVSDDTKREELFCRTPGYLSWQGEYWLACCDDYCAFIGDVGTKELEEMGIADEVFAEFEASGGFGWARENLCKAGSLAGYLFKCLHCGKFHLGVDAD